MKPKKPPRSTRAEDIHRELQKSTDFKRQYVDETLVERKTELRMILAKGSEEDFREALQRSDINPDSAEGKRFIAAFRRMRGLD